MEIVYNDTLNPIVLEIEHNGENANFSDATRMRLHMDGTTLDSDNTDQSSYFDWQTGGHDGTVTFKALGTAGLLPRKYRSALEVFYDTYNYGNVEFDDLDIFVKPLFYTSTARYCSLDDVKALFGVLDDRIKIGSSERDHLSNDEADRFVLRSEEFLNGKLKKIIPGDIPFDSTSVPEEIQFATIYLSAYFIYRTKFLGQMPEEGDPVNQWRRDAFDAFSDFTDQVRAGLTDYSASESVLSYTANILAYTPESQFFSDIEDPVTGDLVINVEI